MADRLTHVQSLALARLVTGEPPLGSRLAAMLTQETRLQALVASNIPAVLSEFSQTQNALRAVVNIGLLTPGSTFSEVQRSLDSYTRLVRLTDTTFALMRAMQQQTRLSNAAAEVSKYVRQLDSISQISRYTTIGSEIARVLAEQGGAVQTLSRCTRDITQSLFQLELCYTPWIAKVGAGTLSGSIPDLLVPLPSREYVLHTELAASGVHLKDGQPWIKESEEIREEIWDTTFVSIEANLARLNPGLLKMWQGAKEAFQSDNSDRVRHAITSLRELSTHVLHLLSSDDKIKAWDRSEALYVNGKPTREARVRFICRNIDEPAFTEFHVQDMLALFAMFNKGTHAIEMDMSDLQLKLVFQRIECNLAGLLDIHFATS